MNPHVRSVGNGVIYLVWCAGRLLTFRPSSVLARLNWASYWMPALFVIGATMCGLRWGHDPLTFLRYAGSFLVWTALLSAVGDRCKKFVLGYCLLSATFDVLGMILIGDAPDGSPIRVSLSAYELAATIGLIVAATRWPRSKPVPG